MLTPKAPSVKGDGHEPLRFEPLALPARRERDCPSPEPPPELTLDDKYCRVRHSTHSIDGLSEKDFIYAGQIELLLQP